MRALKSARSSADFSKLWTASAVSNVGDGTTMLVPATVTPEQLTKANSRMATSRHDRHHHGRLATAARC